MTTSIFEQVRSSCRSVARRAGHVRIDAHRIADYAFSLSLAEARSPSLDRERHYIGSTEDTTAFFLTLDTINFGSGWFPHLKKRPGMSGYYTIAMALTERFRSAGPISANELCAMTGADCTALFGQDPKNAAVVELMTFFARAFNDLGRFLLERFDGRWLSLVASAEQSAAKLVRILAEMPYFRDVHAYGDIEVSFYKRAQLAAADLALAFDGRGPGRFHDLDRLTIFADNLVPHVLRLDGVLTYEASLLQRIADGDTLAAGSAEEIEIRAGAVDAVERIRETLQKAGFHITARGLDYLLWHRGQQPEYKAMPRHRTRCVYY
ncbi:MAG TPA: queuosine salvage family protein [Desulfobacterales bacterium]